MSASPILPAPSTAILRSSTGMPSLGPGARPATAVPSHASARAASGSAPGTSPRFQPASRYAPARPLPLAVGGEQLRRLGRLHPAPAHSGHQLDEAQVADEAVVPAAEAGERDHADRPGPDLCARGPNAPRRPRWARCAGAPGRACGRRARAPLHARSRAPRRAAGRAQTELDRPARGHVYPRR